MRKALSWRLSNTMDASFCREALGEAIAKYDSLEIMNNDQGTRNEHHAAKHKCQFHLMRVATFDHKLFSISYK